MFPKVSMRKGLWNMFLKIEHMSIYENIYLEN